jgi:Domain of unknown function (DUF4337)
MSAHEQMEHAEHAEHAAHSNKRIALVIAVLALCLAFSETLGKSAQTEAISHNVESSNLWAFYQAKTIRQTSLVVGADTLAVTAKAVTDPSVRDAMTKQIEAWRATAARYESEPKPTGGEGRRELSQRATKSQEERDVALAKYHHYEIASAAFQIGIVLASAAVITGIVALAFGSAGLGVVGLIIMGFGLFAPDLTHEAAHLFSHAPVAH